ncbi:MAG: class I SAM-dependent methyltransferase [Gemmatimonadetes bacterium]|nr:class I SAM-dependent methyltransferase [Gemmatimonadota bacterium]
MAESYDRIEDQPFYVVQYRTYERDFERRRETWRGRVFDLGCGTGIFTRKVAEAADYVVGIDVSPGLVRKAREKMDGVRGAVLVADATRLPFKADTFDAVLSYGEPISHIADYESVIEELGRVVAPAGRAVLSVDNDWNLRTIVHPRRLMAALSSRGGSIRDWSFYDDAGREVTLKLKTFTHPELVGLLQRAGFVVEDAVGIHVFTLLAPLATHARIDDWRARLFRWLHHLDRRLADRWPFNRLGYSKIVGAVRRPG